MNKIIDAYLKLSDGFNPVTFLEQNGFTYCGYCNCTGTKNYKYSKGHHIVYYMPKRKLYHLKLINHYLEKNITLSSLCDHLKSLGLLQLETPGQEVK